MKKLITLIVNKKAFEVAVEPNRTLAQVLREDLGFLGTNPCKMPGGASAPAEKPGLWPQRL